MKKSYLERHLDSEAKIEEFFKNKNDKTVIVFADLANSTLFKQKRSFVKGLYKTRKHNLLVANCLKEHGGTIVKYIGDAVMARFDVGDREDEAYRAVLACIKIQEQLDDINHGMTDDLEKIQSKIGMACGVVADFYGNDPQGAVVDLAARIESNAKPNQILVHKPLIDAINARNLESIVGKANRWSGKDYIGEPVKVKLKGIPEPQEIVEIKWKNALYGIKTENEYDEYWEDIRYEATLCDLEEPELPLEIKEGYFRIIFDLRYSTVLNREQFHFVCVDSIEDMNEVMKNRTLFSRYVLPKKELLGNDMELLYRVDFVRVDEVDLYSVPSDEVFKKVYLSRTYKHDSMQALLGKKVVIHYRVSSIIRKRGNFFAMLTEYPVKNLSMSFDMGSVNIRKVHAIDYFSTAHNPKFIYTPNKSNARKVEVIISDWIYPRGGVIFVWDLSG